MQWYCRISKTKSSKHLPAKVIYAYCQPPTKKGGDVTKITDKFTSMQ